MAYKGKANNNRGGKPIKQPQKNKANQAQQQNKSQNSKAPSRDELVEKFIEMFPDYQRLTKDEILDIFTEYNNDFGAVVESVLLQTIQTKPPDSWTDVPTKKKKKQVKPQPKGPQKPRSDQQRGDGGRQQNRGKGKADQNRSQTANARPNREAQPPAGAQRGTQNAANKPRPSNPPSQAAPQSSAVAPPQQPTTQVPYNVHVNVPIQKKPEPVAVTQSVPPTSFSRTTPAQSYANAAKSRQPWSPHTASSTISAQQVAQSEPEPAKPAFESKEMQSQKSVTEQ